MGERRDIACGAPLLYHSATDAVRAEPTVTFLQGGVSGAVLDEHVWIR
jgi:hypothetical protein